MNIYFLLISTFVFHLSSGCFTIVHLNDDPCSHISVILANNRDEDVFRPTDDAAYWPDDASYIYGGRDLIRNYSTWLSMNTKTGRIANLLFIAGHKAVGPAKPTGRLVAMYLHSNYSSVKTVTYLNEFFSNISQYNGVHLVLLDYLETGYWKLYFSNNNETYESNVILHSLVSGTFVVSINMFSRPFQRVLFGSKMFNEILEDHQNLFNDHIEDTANSQEINVLVNKIMHKVLQNRTFLYGNGLDRNLQEQFSSMDQLKLNEVSAINANYTTLWKNAKSRTNTVIIVFRNGSVTYIERTMKFDENNNSYWSFTNNSFVIGSIKPINVCQAKTNHALKLIHSVKYLTTYFLFHLLLISKFQ